MNFLAKGYAASAVTDVAIAPSEQPSKILRRALANNRPPAVATPFALGTTGGLFYLSGAALATVVTVAYPPRGAALDGDLAIVLGAALAGALVLAFGRHLPRLAYHLMNLGGTSLVTCLVLLAHGPWAAALMACLYIYVPLDSFFFFALKWGLAYQAVCVVAVGTLCALGRLGPMEGAGLFVVDAVVGFVVAWLASASDLAEIDRLTGLPNRAGMQRAIQQATTEGRQGNKPVALALFDIDHFHSFNKAYGTAAGDQLLCSFAESIAGGAPRGAHVGRFDGDEFALLLPGFGADDAGELVLAPAPWRRPSLIDVTVACRRCP